MNNNQNKQNICHRCNSLDPNSEHISDLSLCVMKLKARINDKDFIINKLKQDIVTIKLDLIARGIIKYPQV